MYYVYRHTFSNGTIYIGKGAGNRILDNTSRNRYWNSLKNKYGLPIVGIMMNNLTEKEALNLEIKVIRYYKQKNKPLCNITEGGEGCSGYKHTDEHKEYISTVSKTRMNKPEVKEKYSKAFKGANNPMFGVPAWCKGLTKETSKSLYQASLKLKGRPKTDEAKRKLSQTKQGVKTGPLKTDKFTFYNIVSEETVVSTIYDMKEIHKCTDHISSVATGARKSHKGWVLVP